MSDMEAAVEAGWMVLGDPSGSSAIGHVLLTFSVLKDSEGVYVAECPELGVPSFGRTITEALDSVVDATLVYLNTLEIAEQREKVLTDREVAFVPGLPMAGEFRAKRVSTGAP